MKQLNKKIFEKVRAFQKLSKARRPPMKIFARSEGIPLRDLKSLLSTRGKLLKTQRKTAVRLAVLKKPLRFATTFHKKLPRALKKVNTLRRIERLNKKGRQTWRKEAKERKHALWESITPVFLSPTELIASQRYWR